MYGKHHVDGILGLTTGRHSDFKKRHGFSEHTAKIWVRANFRCEYCGQLMVESIAAFYSYQYDHILPSSRYRKNNFVDFSTADLFQAGKLSEDHLNNLALSCRLCNSVKSALDPNANIQAYPGYGPVTASARLALIESARDSMSLRRQEYEEAFELVRNYWAHQWNSKE